MSPTHKTSHPTSDDPAVTRIYNTIRSYELGYTTYTNAETFIRQLSDGKPYQYHAILDLQSARILMDERTPIQC